MPELVRTLRLRDLLLLFIGSVIGSGIFRTPGPILRQVGGSVGLSLLVWVVGGVLSLLGALTYAELAAANPEAGGLYCYIRDGFRSEEHTSELQSLTNLVCRLLLEKKKKTNISTF